MKIIPVIHHKDHQTTLNNAKICVENNVFGIFLIEMNGFNDDLGIIGLQLKKMYPQLKIGLNLLGETALKTVEESISYDLDMSWSDQPIITSNYMSNDALKIKEVIKDKNHLFFNSVAFKYQKEELKPGLAAKRSSDFSFIPTTSGKATGVEVDINKLKEIKEEIKNYPLGIASGLSVENVLEHNPYIEYGLVSTGISKTFYEFDSEKLKQLMNLI